MLLFFLIVISILLIQSSSLTNNNQKRLVNKSKRQNQKINTSSATGSTDNSKVITRLQSGAIQRNDYLKMVGSSQKSNTKKPYVVPSNGQSIHQQNTEGYFNEEMNLDKDSDFPKDINKHVSYTSKSYDPYPNNPNQLHRNLEGYYNEEKYLDQDKDFPKL